MIAPSLQSCFTQAGEVECGSGRSRIEVQETAEFPEGAQHLPWSSIPYDTSRCWRDCLYLITARNRLFVCFEEESLKRAIQTAWKKQRRSYKDFRYSHFPSKPSELLATSKKPPLIKEDLSDHSHLDDDGV